MTAMMAFFLLMWLLSSASTVQLRGIADYFNQPLKTTLWGGDRSARGFEHPEGRRPRYLDRRARHDALERRHDHRADAASRTTTKTR